MKGGKENGENGNIINLVWLNNNKNKIRNKRSGNQTLKLPTN